MYDIITFSSAPQDVFMKEIMNNQQKQSPQPSISQQPQPSLQPEMPKKPNLPNWASILIITVVVIIVGLVSYGAYRYFVPQPEPGELPAAGEEEIIDETADWQTYRNEEYGYELKYPAYLTCQEKHPTGDGTSLLVGFGSPEILEWEIVIKHPIDNTLSSFEAWINESWTIEKTEQVKTQNSEKYLTKQILRLKPDAPYARTNQILVTWNEDNWAKSGLIDLNFIRDWDGQIKVLDQILSTFKFIESESIVNLQTYQGDFFEVDYSPLLWTKDNCQYQLCSVEFGEDCYIIAGLWRTKPWIPVNITTWEIGEYSPQVKEWAKNSGEIYEIDVIFDIEDIGTRSFYLFVSSPDLYEKCKDNFKELLSTVRFIK